MCWGGNRNPSINNRDQQRCLQSSFTQNVEEFFLNSFQALLLGIVIVYLVEHSILSWQFHALYAVLNCLAN